MGVVVPTGYSFNLDGTAIYLLIGHRTSSLDRPRLDRVLDGHDPFDETTMLDGDGAAARGPPEPGGGPALGDRGGPLHDPSQVAADERAVGPVVRRAEA